MKEMVSFSVVCVGRDSEKIGYFDWELPVMFLRYDALPWSSI
jgi:hypothetical protein